MLSARMQIVLRHGKGGKDRVVMPPKAARPDLERQIAGRRHLRECDGRGAYWRQGAVQVICWLRRKDLRPLSGAPLLTPRNPSSARP
jgi:hypothetical protein